MSKRDLYADLELSASASAAEIKAAYRKLARIYHPDVCKEVGGQEKYLIVDAAYQVLSDPDEKRRYDLSRHSPQDYIRAETTFTYTAAQAAARRDELKAQLDDMLSQARAARGMSNTEKPTGYPSAAEDSFGAILHDAMASLKNPAHSALKGARAANNALDALLKKMGG